MNLLDPDELRRLLPAETHAYASPTPTQSVSTKIVGGVGVSGVTSEQDEQIARAGLEGLK